MGIAWRVEQNTWVLSAFFMNFKVNNLLFLLSYFYCRQHGKMKFGELSYFIMNFWIVVQVNFLSYNLSLYSTQYKLLSGVNSQLKFPLIMSLYSTVGMSSNFTYFFNFTEFAILIEIRVFSNKYFFTLSDGFLGIWIFLRGW